MMFISPTDKIMCTLMAVVIKIRRGNTTNPMLKVVDVNGTVLQSHPGAVETLSVDSRNVMAGLTVSELPWEQVKWRDNH